MRVVIIIVYKVIKWEVMDRVKGKERGNKIYNIYKVSEKKIYKKVLNKWTVST